MAVATQDFTDASSKTFVLVLSPTGEMLHEPIAVSMKAFAGAGNASLVLSTLLFDSQSQKVISAFGHENRLDLAQMLTVDLQNDKIIKTWTFEDFMISAGDQSATMNMEAERVYLAGESDQDAHIASFALSNGVPTGQHDLIKVDFDNSGEESNSVVTHIFYEKDALFGAAEILDLPSETT